MEVTTMGRETGDDENRLALQEGPDGDRQVAVRCDEVLQVRFSALIGMKDSVRFRRAAMEENQPVLR